MEGMENWIRVSTAAKLRNVTRQTLYWHVSDGNLKSMALDGVIYVDKNEVLLWKPKGAGEYRPRAKVLRVDPQLRQWYELEELSVEEIANRLDISRQAVYARLKSAGITRRGRSRNGASQSE